MIPGVLAALLLTEFNTICGISVDVVLNHR